MYVLVLLTHTQALGTTCNERIERIHGTEHAYILRVPFRDTSGRVSGRSLVSRQQHVNWQHCAVLMALRISLTVCTAASCAPLSCTPSSVTDQYHNTAACVHMKQQVSHINIRLPFPCPQMLRKWVSRFDLWPYVEQYTLDVQREIMAGARVPARDF